MGETEGGKGGRPQLKTLQNLQLRRNPEPVGSATCRDTPAPPVPSGDPPAERHFVEAGFHICNNKHLFNGHGALLLLWFPPKSDSKWSSIFQIHAPRFELCLNSTRRKEEFRRVLKPAGAQFPECPSRVNLKCAQLTQNEHIVFCFKCIHSPDEFHEGNSDSCIHVFLRICTQFLNN